MPKKVAETPAIKFVGKENYLVGLPARDMSLEEWESYPQDLRAQALGLGLYQMEIHVENGSPTSIDNLGLTVETEEGEGQTGGLQ